MVEIHEKACQSVAVSLGAESLAAEIQRIIERVDLLSTQMEMLSVALQQRLEQLEEARFLATIPGIGWTTIAGLIAQIGPIEKYRHGRQLVKLAGLHPSRHESGKMAGRTTMTRRGRAGLRAVVYMATVSCIQHNPRLRAHYERLVQRTDRPLSKMKALGACMTKFLMYAFAVMKNRCAFDSDHVWRSTALG
jgi:transposase